MFSKNTGVNMKHLSSLLLLSFAFWGCKPNLPDNIQIAYDNLPERIDFNLHVKPLLSDNCYACHGPDKANQKAGLQLHELSLAQKVSENGLPAISPGKPFDSEAIKRILSEDDEIIMPPPDSHLSLTDREKAILIKWVEEGAEYKKHWSFIKPEKTEPAVKEAKDWAKNEIDHFIVAKLTENSLPYSEEANKTSLIRRVSFTLRGLPPSIEEIEQYLNDDSEAAYENMIDRFLESDAYGERMAMDWMDVSRYADSDGYLDDKHRDFSPWRNWVIKAFNENMPYDQFITWQLAGDLIENPTQESILATAFNRLHRKNSEAGIVFEEYRTEYVADRAHTVGKAVMGLTIECARCHDHKYDPISQKDYYELFGFFNSTHELGTAVYGPGQTPGPSLLLTDEADDALITSIKKNIAKEEAELNNVRRKNNKAFDTWQASVDVEKYLAQNLKKGLHAQYNFDDFKVIDEKTKTSKNAVPNIGEAVLKEVTITEGYKGKAFEINEFSSLNFPEKLGWFDRNNPFTISLAVYPDTIYEEAGLFYHSENLRLGLKGYSALVEDNHLRFVIAHSWPQNSIEVRTKKPLKVKDWTHITITYDGSSAASGVSIYFDGKKTPTQIVQDNLYKNIIYEPDIHTYGFNGFNIGFRGKIKVMDRARIDELKIYGRALNPLEVMLDHDTDNFSAWHAGLENTSKEQMLKNYFYDFIDHDSQAQKARIEEERIRLFNLVDSIPEIMVMGDLKEPRKTYVLDRGMYNAPTEEVFPAAPDAVMPYDTSFEKNRLGLAKWLFHKDNPLTARVYVNRIWQMHFGKGLVETSDDFGNQGSLPSHPKLLDWLAVTFMESGWDIKQLHKTILMSATYRQSSKITKELLEKDPENILLARGPSQRMAAEMIRDNALAISGLLVNRKGGQSVYPYQPEGLWDEISNKVWRYRYLQEPGDGLYRRSLYTIWKRTSPPPSLMIFDAPDRSFCTVNREETSTPLQALVLLNDPQFLEAARVLAENLVAQESDTTMQLKKAFSMVTGRTPDNTEIEIIHKFYKEEVSRFETDKKDALDYLSIGETPRNENLSPVQTAALATVINGIMNTSEAYTLK